LLDGMDTITKEAIENLSEADQRALFSYFGDLQNRRPGSTLRDINNLGQVHNAAEGADYAKFADHFAESGLDVTGPTMRQRFYGASTADEAVAGRSAVDDLFESPVSPSTADPLDNAPPTVRVTDDVDGRTVRAETENPRGLDDLSDDPPTTARSGEDPGDDIARTSDDAPARTGDRNPDTTDTVRTTDNTPARTNNGNPDTNNNARPRDNTSTSTARNDPDATADTVRASDDTLRADADTLRTSDDTPVRPVRNDPDATADTVRASDDTLRADADTIRTGDDAPVRTTSNDPNTASARNAGDASDPNGPFVGLDERLGPEFRGALDEDSATPARVRGDAADPNGPFVGLDERLGPEFRGALDGDAATPAARTTDTPEDTFRPATSDGPDTARVDAGPSDWKADLENVGDVTVVGPDGVSRRLNFGERRGRGVSAAVYKDGDEAGSVLRVREYDDVSVYNRINDDVGRGKMQSVLDENPDADFVRLAEMRGQVRVESSSDPQLNGKMVEFVEEVESTAFARIANQDGIPTEGQLVAMDQAKRLLNRNGLVWTDGHYKNFDLVPAQVPGRPDVHQVVIFDTGHVYPVRGDSPFQQWENARTIQREFAVPPDEFVRDLNSVNSGGPANRLVRQKRLNDIHRDHSGMINRGDLPPGMSEDHHFGGAPHIGAERPLYRDIASLDADAADQRYFEHTGKRPPSPPEPDGADLAREAEPIRISMTPPADPPAANTPVARSSGVPDGDETLDVDVADTNVGRNFDDEATLDVDDVNAGAGRNFDDEATLDVDVADTNVGRNAGGDTTRFDNSDLDTLGNNTLRLDDPDLPGPWAPASDDLRNWETPDGVMVTDEAMLGQGNFADVHRLLGPDGAPSGSVRKHFDVNTGTGDTHLLAQQQGRVRASAEGSNQLQRADVLQAELRHVDAQNGTIIQREVNADLPAGVTRETVVEDIVRERGAGPLDEVESEGVARMFKKLNENEIAMEDPNLGNIFLREIPGSDTPVRAGVLDQDRIISKEEFGLLDHVDTNTPTPTNGIITKSEADELGLDLDSGLWEETTYMGQPVYESRTNIGDFKNVWEEREFSYFRTLQREGRTTAEIADISVDGLLPTPKAFNYYTMIEKGWLKYEPGVGFSSGTMDIKAAARELPDLPEVLHLTPGDEWQNAAQGPRADLNNRGPAPYEYSYDEELRLAA